MASVITITGEQLFAAKAQANEQLDIDTFIFANVPNQNPNAPINREEGIPTAHIVYQQNVQQVGRINDNVVVYSTVLDSITGPFEFNWVGLYSSVNQKLVAINHVPTVTKTATAPGAAGNTLNRNFGIEYSGIAELTGISVEPETWQLDFTARLSGMDLLTQQLAADMNGKDWFIDDGLKVVPRATANTFSVTPGVGYVSGLRVELKQEHILIVQSYPQFVYVDAWFSGNANSTWSPQLAFTVTNTEMDDYIDPSGTQHYVYKLAVINAANNVEDLRSTDGLSNKIDNLKNNYDKELLVRWERTGSANIELANTIVPETGMKYDERGREYKYKADTCYVLEDFGYGPSATPQWNSRVFNALVKLAYGMFVASRTGAGSFIYHDAPIDIMNRVTVMLPQGLKVRKITSTVGNVSRKITPAGGSRQDYTWNKRCLFNIIPENDTINYAIYVNFVGGELGGDGHSNVGVFDAPMAAYCKIEQVICAESQFFWKGLDNWQNAFSDIRSRFSANHFYIPIGTSNDFRRVACDGGSDGTSNGVGFLLGCSYTNMSSCAADGISMSYDFIGNAEVTMSGCGSESFGRIIRTNDNAVVNVNGGSLLHTTVESSVGAAREPWSAYGNSKLLFNGTNLKVANYSEQSDDAAFAGIEKPLASGTASLICNNAIHPSAGTAAAKFQGDELLIMSGAYGEWNSGHVSKVYTAASRYITTTKNKQRSQKEIAGLAVDGTWKTLGQFDVSAYGSSLMGKITLEVYSPYASSVGLVGYGTATFAAALESSGGLVACGSSALAYSRVDFSSTQPAPTVELQVIASGGLALVQVKLTSGGGTVAAATVGVDITYTSRKSGSLGRIDFV